MLKERRNLIRWFFLFLLFVWIFQGKINLKWWDDTLSIIHCLKCVLKYQFHDVCACQWHVKLFLIPTKWSCRENEWLLSSTQKWNPKKDFQIQINRKPRRILLQIKLKTVYNWVCSIQLWLIFDTIGPN